MQRLLMNKGGYHGECIPIIDTLRDIEQAAVAAGWEKVPICPRPVGRPPLPAFRRPGPPNAREIYISSGMHGDEPAGPLAVLQLLREHAWPDTASFWLVPCLNPGGFVRNTREDELGTDLNRDYRAPQTAVVQAHVAWLQERPRFDLTLLLHEDWEANGFYLYELNPQHRPSIAPAIINQVMAVCPVDTSSSIEGRPAAGGIISANPDLNQRPDWPEAFYLIHHKSPLSYTLEAPSDYPLETRVKALVTGVRAALQEFTK